MKKYYLSDYKEDHYSYNLLKASLLQKLIRRGMAKEAAYIAKIYLDENQEKGLKRRLQIIAAEDIGFGWIESILYLEKEQNLILATYNLALSKKNRESDRFLLYVVNHGFNLNDFSNEKKKEIKVFQKILNSSSIWAENKSKESLNKLKSLFQQLIDNSNHKDVVSQLLDNYLSLTKQKVHGARCQLALAVLISCRKFKEEKYIPVSTYEINSFDEIYDFAIDMHTPIGKELKRGFDHWVDNCVFVENEYNYPELIDKNGEKYPLNKESNKFK